MVSIIAFCDGTAFSLLVPAVIPYDGSNFTCYQTVVRLEGVIVMVPHLLF